ncbi:sugar ABC transporter permease [Microbacterium sp. Y-01]|uniref:carbohydrate ABC transporter permease n=1 Tax=Microbacterium sp. Y-01 TaxID=2048898 RepID=UPI001F1526BA|nr:sugar ABC transporter permease [Microbacterium sp. Y-01]
MLFPLGTAAQYSLYDWDGIGQAEFIGLSNYAAVFTDPELYGSILHSLALIVFFTVLPILIAVAAASVARRVSGRFGAVGRVVLFIPQVLPLAASALAWNWVYSSNGVINQILEAVGLGALARPWLGDFDTALPALGLVGTWVGVGFCLVLLLTGMAKIDPSLFEAAALDGAGFFRELRSVTIPGIRREIGVCVTVTVISALQTFDLVYMTTRGGPGVSTMVPGLQIYQLAFTKFQVGQSSALGIVLMVIVVAIAATLQAILRERDE